MLFSLTNPEIAIMMMGIFLFAVLLGFPIAFTLMAMGVGFGYYAYFDPTKMEHLFDNRIFQLFVQNTYTVMDNTCFTAVPLFLFMGYLVERAGIVAKLFFAIRLASHTDFLHQWQLLHYYLCPIFNSNRNYRCSCYFNGITSMACND